MTTPPVDGEPPADVKEPTPDTPAPSGHESDDDSSDTDAMGIDDDDPIDATLVGEPVDGGDQDDAGPTEPASD